MMSYSADEKARALAEIGGRQSTKARRELGWEVRFPDIDSIVATAWRWHRSHPDGFG